MALSRLLALSMLSECSGDEIWSLEYCRSRGVPDSWLQDLQDCFESNPQRDRETIYVGDKALHQYEGVRDVDLAVRLGEYLGVDVEQLLPRALSRSQLVRSIREAVEEL